MSEPKLGLALEGGGAKGAFHIGAVQARRRGEPPPLPINLDCRHCTMCNNGK